MEKEELELEIHKCTHPIGLTDLSSSHREFVRTAIMGNIRNLIKKIESQNTLK